MGAAAAAERRNQLTKVQGTLAAGAAGNAHTESVPYVTGREDLLLGASQVQEEALLDAYVRRLGRYGSYGGGAVLAALPHCAALRGITVVVLMAHQNGLSYRRLGGVQRAAASVGGGPAGVGHEVEGTLESPEGRRNLLQALGGVTAWDESTAFVYYRGRGENGCATGAHEGHDGPRSHYSAVLRSAGATGPVGQSPGQKTGGSRPRRKNKRGHSTSPPAPVQQAGAAATPQKGERKTQRLGATPEGATTKGAAPGASSLPVLGLGTPAPRTPAGQGAPAPGTGLKRTRASPGKSPRSNMSDGPHSQAKGGKRERTAGSPGGAGEAPSPYVPAQMDTRVGGGAAGPSGVQAGSGEATSSCGASPPRPAQDLVRGEQGRADGSALRCPVLRCREREQTFKGFGAWMNHARLEHAGREYGPRAATGEVDLLRDLHSLGVTRKKAEQLAQSFCRGCGIGPFIQKGRHRCGGEPPHKGGTLPRRADGGRREGPESSAASLNQVPRRSARGAVAARAMAGGATCGNPRCRRCATWSGAQCPCQPKGGSLISRVLTAGRREPQYASGETSSQHP